MYSVYAYWTFQLGNNRNKTIAVSIGCSILSNCFRLFVGKKIYTSPEKREAFTGGGYKRYLARLIKKLIVFEIINLCIYIPLWILEGNSIIDAILVAIRSIIVYPIGSLWFIQALIIGILLNVPFIKKAKEKLALIIGIALYCFALICNRYYFLIEGLPAQKVVDLYLKVFDSARNGLFYGFLFVNLGIIVCKYEEKLRKHKTQLAVFTVLAYMVYVAEVYLTRNYMGTDDNALFITHTILIPSLVALTSQIELKKMKCNLLLRNLSTSIYLLHRPIMALTKIIVTYAMGYELTLLSRMVIVFVSLAVVISLLYKLGSKKVMEIIT